MFITYRWSPNVLIIYYVWHGLDKKNKVGTLQTRRLLRGLGTHSVIQRWRWDGDLVAKDLTLVVWDPELDSREGLMMTLNRELRLAANSRYESLNYSHGNSMYWSDITRWKSLYQTYYVRISVMIVINLLTKYWCLNRLCIIDNRNDPSYDRYRENGISSHLVIECSGYKCIRFKVKPVYIRIFREIAHIIPDLVRIMTD